MSPDYQKKIRIYRPLTEYEKWAIWNGCGGKGGKIKPPQFVFKESCDQHDINYYIGFTEKHRKKADKQFLSAMIDQIKKESWFKRPFLYPVSYGYYLAVRVFGNKYFYYGNEEQVLPFISNIQRRNCE